MRYIKSLDGIRAVAVLLVMAFHFGYLGFGWLGVQVFFVLSGFLITQILYEQKTLPLGHYLKRFYWRRTLRIFPLYYGYLLLLALTFVLLGEPDDFGRTAPTLFTYTYNFTRMLPDDPGGGTLSHFWSLAVEEQFYLVWPLVIFAVPRRWFKRVLIGLIIGIPLLRLGLGQWALTWAENSDHAGRIVYAFTFSHFDAFATGAAVALFRFDRVQHPRRLFYAALLALVVIGLLNDRSLALQGFTNPWTLAGDGAAVTCAPERFALLNQLCNYRAFGLHIHMFANGQYVWGYTLINLVSGAAILASRERRPVARWLENRVIVRLGQISYGLYVFHMPVLVYLSRFIAYDHLSLRGVGVFVVYCLLTWIVAEISFRFFESRFTALKDRYDRKHAIVREDGQMVVRPVSAEPALINEHA